MMPDVINCLVDLIDQTRVTCPRMKIRICRVFRFSKLIVAGVNCEVLCFWQVLTLKKIELNHIFRLNLAQQINLKLVIRSVSELIPLLDDS
jgi:hypothetical protein